MTQKTSQKLYLIIENANQQKNEIKITHLRKYQEEELCFTFSKVQTGNTHIF